MENQNQQSGSELQTINIQVPSADNIASRRSLIPLLFSAVIIFFFFNFFVISCGGQKVGSVKGINLVTGTQLKSKDMFSGKEIEGEKIPSNAWAIIAFGAAVIGLGAFLIKEKREAIIGTGAGAIGFGSLLILQFAINSAIEKKAEGAVQTDFQFAYWAALIAMGIAGFISYLRMQKTHKVVVLVVPPSNPPNENNIAQSLTSNNSIEQTNNFDIGEWFSKNKKIVFNITSIAIVLFGVYYFFIKHDPIKDAKNATFAFCDCSTKYNDAMININEELIKSFDSYGFKKRQEVRNKLQDLQNSADSENLNCNNIAQQKYSKKRNRYIADKELLEKFDFAYNAQSGTCNPKNQTKLSSLYLEIENKIATIKDPLPNIENIKNNLIGQKIPGWNFDYLNEFQKFNIIKTNESSDRLEYNLGLILLDQRSNILYPAEVIVTYFMAENGWYFENVKLIYIDYSYTAPIDDWLLIKIIPDCSYNRIDNGYKYYVMNPCTGETIQQGPDVTNIVLNCTDIFIKSREVSPVEIVLRYMPVK